MLACDRYLRRHLGQHCPGSGGSGLGQGGRAQRTRRQSMVGRTVGGGGFVGAMDKMQDSHATNIT